MFSIYFSPVLQHYVGATYRAHGVKLISVGEVCNVGLDFLHWGVHYAAAHEADEGERQEEATHA